MFLSRLELQNWRTYGFATFEFKEPTVRKNVVLVGAMNGHGKTSFLVSLYLGLFGKYGLRYCEGFNSSDETDASSYRIAIGKYRRNQAYSDEPTVIDVTFTPTTNDDNEQSVRVVRRWYFTSKNEPKQGEAFEEVDVYIDGRLQRRGDLEKDPIQIAHERIERYLFPAHVAPAFFFDGEQAQKLIENMGEAGIKKAVEVMFGTKVISELSETITQYIVKARLPAGGKKKASERQNELDDKVAEREQLNERIAKLQADHQKLEREKEQKERERNNLQEDLAKLGGAGNLNEQRIQADYTKAENELNEAEKSICLTVQSLGFSLALSRLSTPISNRLKREEARENWEGLKRGTLENKEKVLQVALPEPADADPLLGNLSSKVREKVRERFIDALDRIYNPPPIDCAPEYVLGHIRGEARVRAQIKLSQIGQGGSSQGAQAARRMREARDAFEDAKSKVSRADSLPAETKQIRDKLDILNAANQDISRKLGALENEIRKLKADLYTLNEVIGRISEELARLGPEQQRIAVAERVGRALEELQEQLRPTTTARLEDYVTKHFVSIADRRYKNGKIHLPHGGVPEFELEGGTRSLLEMFSGFEKRTFGIAFSLALAEITRRRIPLVIDTPLGNADSEYRPRTLKAFTDFDMDQVIVLTHDEEVTPKLVEEIKSSLSQTFLVEFAGHEKGSIVHANRYFKE